MRKATWRFYGALTSTLIGLSAPASAAIVAAGYTFTGNAVAVGQNGCAAVTGTFPATLRYFMDTSTGLITTGFLNILIQNASTGLKLQTIRDVIQITGNGAGNYTAYDPQLFGTSTALNGVPGTFSGIVTFPTDGTFELGSNFGQSNQTSLVLTSGTCIISLTGILYANPD